jgi:hypothetical protein
VFSIVEWKSAKRRKKFITTTCLCEEYFFIPFGEPGPAADRREALI